MQLVDPVSDLILSVVLSIILDSIILGFIYWKYKMGIAFKLVFLMVLMSFFNSVSMSLGPIFISDPTVGFIARMTVQGVLPIGILLFAIYIVIVHISLPLNKMAETNEELAQGNLNIEFPKKISTNDEVDRLKKASERMINFLKPLLKETSSLAKVLAEASQELASSTEEVNASSEEISSITQQMSLGAQQQTNQITLAIQQSERIEREFTNQIEGLSTASELIGSISKQVNMLALNASIEAARAGEYGRGFAVVADNIRRLADETNVSLGGINQIVEQLERSLGGLIKTITHSIQTVAAISEQTAAGAEEASAATEEQAATMEEMSASAQELAKMAIGLQNVVDLFKT
ncbi:MAG: methyl-accepting chemotaxis protein [Promethearchaeota archaeon]